MSDHRESEPSLSQSAEDPDRTVPAPESSDSSPLPLSSTLNVPDGGFSFPSLGPVVPGKMPVPGQQLGDFQFLEVLGKGAFATVYLATQISLDRSVALKVCTNESPEAKTLASLEHEHIIPVYVETVNQEHELRLMAMKFVPGTDLEHVLKELHNWPPSKWNGQVILETIDRQTSHSPRFDLAAFRAREELEHSDFVEAACWIGEKLTEALAHAHSQGVLHRDIKPANVLMDRYGRPLLSDFNLAASSRLNVGDRNFGGTLRYMAPEHLDAFDPTSDVSSDTVDARSDLYSLGVVLYELLTGQPLLGSRTSKANGPLEMIHLLAEDRREEPPSLQLQNPNLPAVVDQVVRRCLEPDPNERYQSAEELGQALAGCRELRRAERNLPPPLPLTRFCLARPVLMFIVLAFLPHLLGSVVNISYNSQAIVTETKLTRAQIQAFDHLLLGYNVLIYPICLWVVYRAVIPTFRLRRRLLSSEKLTAEEAQQARQQALRLPLWVVLMSCVGWFPCCVVFPLGIALLSEPLSLSMVGHFLFSFTVSGLIAATYAYFGIQFFVVRILYPYLWVDPDEPRVQMSEELHSVENRQRVFQFLAGLIPLSGAVLVLLVGPSEEFSVLFRALVVGLLVLGMAGFGAALMISSQVSQTIAVLVGHSERTENAPNDSPTSPENLTL